MLMPTNFLSSEALLQGSEAENLYEKLVVQLQKDFQLANIDFELAEGIRPLQLKQLLHEKLYRLIMEKFADYLSLMYVVDVSEKQLKSITSNDVVEVAEQVTFLLLKREWQKVWFKNKL